MHTDQSTVLVTGGPGSFGSTMVRKLLDTAVREVRILSRDELKQHELRQALNDPRVRFYNQTYRGPYDEAGERLWYVAGGPPSNEGMRLARGRWLCGMDDDDVCRANRVELLLAAQDQPPPSA